MNHGGHPHPAMMGAPQQPMSSDWDRSKKLDLRLPQWEWPRVLRQMHMGPFGILVYLGFLLEMSLSLDDFCIFLCFKKC